MNQSFGQPTLCLTGRLRGALARLFWLTACACALAALCLRLADLFVQPGTAAPAQAALPSPHPTPLVPPSFETLRYTGQSAFKYTPRSDTPHSFVVNTAPALAPQAVPEPEPDLSGLRLVATLTATGNAQAILEQAGGSAQMVVSLGGTVRESFVSAIGPSGIELTRGRHTAFLPLWSPWNAVSPAPSAMPEADGRGMVHRVSAPSHEKAAATSVAVRREEGRRHLGVAVRSLDANESKAVGLPPGAGLAVTGVSRAGIDVREGDVLTALDGRTISSISMVLDALRDPNKSSMRFTLIRDGHKADVNILLFD
jgi:hypothetical protein